MLLKVKRRARRSRLLRIVLVVLPAVLLDFFYILSQYHEFQQNLIAQTIYRHQDLPSSVQQHRVFISAQFWSSEDLLNTYWIDAFLRLVHVLGPENIYVSILSSHGLDNTEDAVRRLDAQLAELGVPRSVVIDPTTHEEVVSATSHDSKGNPNPGWVATDPSRPAAKERRRIPYLSELRNRALDILQHLHDSGRTFDRILFINDVIFGPNDILTLLATNGGDFDVACGLDYHLPPALYDTFALRDTTFQGPITSIFPYFRKSHSRSAMLAGSPTPVTSCWNGVVVVDAAPYYDQITAAQPNQIHKALRFRGVPDSLAAYYVEASECCLIHADLLASGQAQRGMYVNPAVRTAYVAEAYKSTHYGLKTATFVSIWQYWSGTWVTRLRHWWKDAVSISAGQNAREVYRRIKLWELEGDSKQRREVGDYCTVLEMQILISNGWKHLQNDVGENMISGPIS